MKRHYTWQTFEMDVETIKDWIRKNKVSFDAVFAPSRGGLVLGTRLSHELNIPLGIIDYQTRVDFRAEERPRLAINPLQNNKGFVLIVDEIIDSGRTINEIKKQFDIDYPDITYIVASIYKLNPNEDDIYLREMQKDDWIYFPWEKKTENTCLKCINSEDCNKYGSNFIHCKVKNQSLNKNDYCREYFLPR